MKIKLINTELFIKANNLQEVTNPIIMDRGGNPSVDGLLSTEIFGTTPKARKTTFAYIDLHGYFLHPLVYKQIKRIDRRIDAIIGGTKTFTIGKGGELVEDPNGQTGLDWLYKNWEKIKFKKNESDVRNERIQLLEENPKDVIFMKRYIVEPAFYRDVNLQSEKIQKSSLHELNSGSDQIANGSSYTKLLRLTKTLERSGNFTFALNSTKFQIQTCIVDLYDYFKSRIEKKFGIIKKGIMGKSIDYGSRMVISSPHFNTNSYRDNIVDFEHCGLPLANCISNATPFFAGWLINFFRRTIESIGNKYPYLDLKTNKLTYVTPKDPSVTFNDKYCEKLIDIFIHSPSQRFDTFDLPNEEGLPAKLVFTGKLKDKKEEAPKRLGVGDRFLTMTDVFYMAACEIYRDRYVMISRYPISGFQSLYPCKVRPLTTLQTCEVQIPNGEFYKYYPVIDLNLPKNRIPSQFIEVFIMPNVYLSTLGADYDGDQISVRTVFSQEANKECEEMFKRATNFVSANGSAIRSTTNEAVQCLYAFTKDV